jgi:hypothetical protein
MRASRNAVNKLPTIIAAKAQKKCVFRGVRNVTTKSSEQALPDYPRARREMERSDIYGPGTRKRAQQ